MGLNGLQLLEALLPFADKSGTVEVDCDVIQACMQELNDKQVLARELEQAHEEARMKPSVARKLNEKIRGLEAELEQLRTNKKVKELEKKVHFLEHELKQSYTTKNFTVKSGLLDLQKQYRPHISVDPVMAAFWADVSVLLDEKKDKDAAAPQFQGPPTLAPVTGSTFKRSSAGGLVPAVGAGPWGKPDGSSTPGPVSLFSRSTMSSSSAGGSIIADEPASTEGKDNVTFKALPADFGPRTAGDTPAVAEAAFHHTCGQELEQAAGRLCSLLQGLLQLLQETTSSGGLLAARLAPAAAVPSLHGLSLVYKRAETAAAIHAATQAAVDQAHTETQNELLRTPSVHAETQAELAAEASHAEVQTDLAAEASHAEVQTDLAAEASHAEVQTDLAAEASHAEVQTDLAAEAFHAEVQTDLAAEASHAEVQTDLAAEASHAEVQTDARGGTAHAEVQYEPLSPVAAEMATQTLKVESSVAATQSTPPASPVHAAVQTLQAQSGSSPDDMQSNLAAEATSSLPDLNEEQQQQQQQGDHAFFALPPAPPPSALSDEEQKAGSGIIYSASGAELPVRKVAVGQQLDILYQLQRRAGKQSSGTPSGAGAADAGGASASGAQAERGISEAEEGPWSGQGQASSGLVSAVCDVRPEELADVEAVAQELSKLRADNLELAASLQVTKSLVDHLNSSMKAAIDKADDAEADAAHIRHK
eukprot:gene2473-2776_t